MLQKTISVPSHCIFADLNINPTQKEVIEFSPFIRQQFFLKPVSAWLCFARKKKRWWKEGLILWPAGT